MTTLTAHALSALLDRSWLEKQCGGNVQATALRIKPTTSILAALQTPSEHTFQGWARFMWPDGHTKAQKTQLWAQERGLHVASAQVFRRLVFQHGDIAADPKLGTFLQPDFLGFALFDAPGTILRYNPSRRIVYRRGTDIVRVTVAQDNIGFPLHQLISKVLSTPARLDDGANPRVSVTEVVGDTDLARNPDPAATYHAGRLLAELHEATSVLPLRLGARLESRFDSFTERMQAHIRIFQIVAPELARRIIRLVGRLPEAPYTSPVLVHGDASPDQFLISATGEDIWLTDFDRAQIAPAATDLGSYLSTVDPSFAEPLLEGYANTRGFLPPRAEIHAAQLRAMALRIAEPMRSGNPQWRIETADRLARMENLL